MLILDCEFSVEELQTVLLIVCRDSDLLDVSRLLIVEKKVPIGDEIVLDGMPLVAWAVKEMLSFRSRLAEMLILDRKLPLNHLRIDGLPLLIWATKMVTHNPGLAKHAIDYLLRGVDTDLDITDGSGNTALHLACRIACEEKDHMDIVNMLLNGDYNHSASVNVTNHQRDTPLHIVCYASTGKTEKNCGLLIEKLLAKRSGESVMDINVNSQNAIGNTALHVLCLRGKKVLVKKLLSFELNVKFELKNNENRTALQLTDGSREWKRILRRNA